MKMNRKGFTLVEIMIVVAIIALLAMIAIPNLLRARLSANDALAKSTLRTLSTATETYATANSGNYPAQETDLTAPPTGPKYLNKPYCNTTVGGFGYTCVWGSDYVFTATPTTLNISGSSVFTITSGGVLQ